MTTDHASYIDQKTQANRSIVRHTLIAGGAGFIPVPGLDTASVLGVQVMMLSNIAKIYGVEFREKLVKSLIVGLVGDLTVIGIAKVIPGLGTLLGGASSAVVSSAATYALGKVFTQHFAQGGNLLDFNPHKVRTYFQEEFEKGKSFVAEQGVKALGSATSERNESLYNDNQEIASEIALLKEQIELLKHKKAAPAINFNDLKIIEGIGPKVEAVLKAGGIEDLYQLAQVSPEEIKEILAKAEGNFNMMVPTSWPQQAALVVQGNLSGLKKLQDELLAGK